MNPQPIFKSPAGREAILAAYERMLAGWPVPSERLMLPTPLGETFVLASGADPALPPLVLLHGSSSNSAIWIGDVAEYARTHRVYCVDIPGEPGQSAEARPDLSGPAYAEWLLAVLDGLKIERCALLGISLGGFLALKFSVAYPQRVRQLALLCPSGVAPQRQSFIFKAIPLMLLGHWGSDRITRMLYAGLPISKEETAYMRLMTAGFNPRVVTIPLFTDDELRRLSMPVLMIGGAKDALLPSEKTAARLRALLPCVETNVLPGVGHVITNQSPRVRTFLSANPG